MRLVSEQCSAISISTLQKKIRKIVDQNSPDSTEEEIFKFTEEELKKFHVDSQNFSYTFIKNHLGGHRWFFVCEKCKGRVQKLFLPPETYPEYEHKYLCKNCHKLCNESVLKANNNIYKKVIRPLKKLHEIEEKLEKGHLTEKKVEELLNEYDAVEQIMKNCIEYRQYVFKKKRGVNRQLLGL
jgi:hypothetical protein